LGDDGQTRDADTFSMDPDWLFIKQDVTGAQAVAFNDSTWTTVSTPHTFNDVDSYRVVANHSSGDTGTFTGPTWYRKHFNIPSSFQGSKVIIEFERIRQGATFYMNGTQVGQYYDGITACGIDVTANANFGTTENVLAVRVDNSDVTDATGTGFQWENKATNPNYGGLVGHVWLHLPSMVYQTYPLWNNLQTSGVYIYPSNFTIATPSSGSLTVNVQAQVKNDSTSPATVGLSVNVIDPTTGSSALTFQSASTTAVPAGQAVTLTANGNFANAKLWSDVTPNLYDVVTTLTSGGSTVSTRTTRTGFRQTEFKGGVGTGGLYINGRFTYLLGFAQRASNDWAGLGEAIPDWMHDYQANLIKGSYSNYIRWMHITPQKMDVIAHDKAGIVNIAPAGDKESDVTGQQWTQREDVMQASMIYLRNNPSVILWEVGNSSVPGNQMQDMSTIQSTWDPNGGTGMGDRDMEDATGAAYAQWFGTMVAFDPSIAGAFASDTTYFRGYTNAYRDQGPIVEEEDERDEAGRHIWDKYTPPHVGGFVPGPLDTYHWDQESFIVGDSTGTAAVNRLNIWLNTYSIRNTDSVHSRYSGYASIYFSDDDADGREESSYVCRVSGKVDAVRLPKEIYYAHQVIGNPQPQVHIIGHWTYPAGTTKTMYVIANTASVELFVNGTSIGKSSTPTDTYVFSFPNVAWASGTIKAVGYDSTGASVATYQLQTAGTSTAIKLTPTVDPNGGLKANGYDVAMIDVEVVDANGMRRPDDEDKITFTVTGPGIWRGGVNESVLGSTNNLYLNTECGINRVFVRSTLTAGSITVTASRTGLTTGTVTIPSNAVTVTNGLY
jgi:beta-galactosidase